ncbi:MAG: redoxin domain-containing protein [Bacteroidota bacterium]|nr:redoxin domain-containing protein [Bacteroidota bacterium]
MKQIFFLLFWFPLISWAAKAPNFTVTDYNNNVHKLYEDYLDKDKVVVIKFFFVDCPPCNDIAPYVQQAYVRWGAGSGRVQFIELSIRNYDQNSRVKTYSQSHGLTFPGVGNDGGSVAATGPYQNGQFGPWFGTPSYAVIAPDGEVNYGVPFTKNDQSKFDTAVARALRTDTGGPDPGCTKAFSFEIIGSKQPNSYLISDISLGNPTYSIPKGIYQCEFNLPQNTSGYQMSLGVNDADLDPLKGVTTQDIVLIQKHILGITLFNNLQYAVSDVNGNFNVSSSDIVELRKLILGINTTLSKVDDIFPVVHNPLGKDYIIKDRVKMDDVINMTKTNQFAIGKYGDASGAKLSLSGDGHSRNSSCSVHLQIVTKKESNGEYSYVILNKFPVLLVTLQFALKGFDVEIYDLVPSTKISSFSNKNYALDQHNKQLRLSWDEALLQGYQFTNDEIILSFKSKYKLNLSNSKTKLINEATTHKGEVCNFKFTILDLSGNPKIKITGESSAGEIYIQSESIIKDLLLFNIQGKLEQSQHNIFSSECTMELTNIPHGIYFIQAIYENGDKEVLKIMN